MPRSLGKRLLQKEKEKAKKQAEGEAEEEKALKAAAMADKKEDAAAAAFESSAFGTTRIHAACVCIYRGRARE